MPVDWKRERNQQEKGSYRRKLDDTYKALSALHVSDHAPEVAFVFNYMACEKIAKLIILMSQCAVSIDQPRDRRFFDECDVATACVKVGFDFSKESNEAIFSQAAGSARSLRHNLFHDMGPTQVFNIQKDANRLNQLMDDFLQCKSVIIEFLDAKAVASK